MHLKLQLARLQLETQDRAQVRKDELQHQLELYRVDTDKKVKMRQLELQAQQDDSGESKKYLYQTVGLALSLMQL